MTSLGSDHLGSMSHLRKYPRGESGRSRRPLNTGRLYDYAITTSAIVFFAEGMRGQLGPGPSLELKTIIAWLGMSLECAFSVDMDYYQKCEAQSRAAGETNRGFFTSHAAHEYKMPRDYVQELFGRDYLYRDEIDPRLALSGLAGSSNLVECLPGVVRHNFKEGHAAYRALEMLLRALPGSVYEANLLEFMFEHNEANGKQDVRSRWSALWR